jgi:hypothetical protein
MLKDYVILKTVIRSTKCHRRCLFPRLFYSISRRTSSTLALFGRDLDSSTTFAWTGTFAGAFRCQYSYGALFEYY